MRGGGGASNPAFVAAFFFDSVSMRTSKSSNVDRVMNLARLWSSGSRFTTK